MNRSQAIEFAASSALTAIDQRDAYTDSFASYRENLIDTMNDEGVTGQDYLDALEMYDSECKILKDKQLAWEARGQTCAAWIEGMNEGRAMSVAKYVGDFSQICPQA